jgi:hypothetical protein
MDINFTQYMAASKSSETEVDIWHIGWSLLVDVRM